MRAALSLFSVLYVSATLVAAPAMALEPDPPQALISPEEAVIISLRMRLDDQPRGLDKASQDERRALAQFYTTEAKRPVWVTADGLTPRAQKVIAEIGRAAQWGLDPADFDLPTLTNDAGSKLTTQELINAELKMSLAAAKYARYASGGLYDPKDLSNDIDRTPTLPDPGKVISTLLAASDPAAALLAYHPQQEQFKRLRLAYLKALDDEKNPRSDEAEAREDNGRRKKSSRRKKRSGTKISDRLRYNMEMWRWMPRDLGRTYVMVNIPEFMFHVIRDGKVIHEERIVTGKVANKTPIFSDEMETVVLNPNWNIPNSIKVKELLPGLLQGRDMISGKGYRVEYGGRDVDPYSVNWATTDIRNFHIYQPPGGSNALGRVKFLFPNKHAVYLHDTPSKYLFKKKKRAFSHGCVRIRNPMKFAELLLGEDKGWSPSEIEQMRRSNPRENQIALTTKIPVHIGYFTAIVDDNGKTTFYDDIYDYEKLIQMGLDGKADQIVKPKKNLSADLNRITASAAPPQEDSYSQSYGYQSGGRPPRWMREVWGWD